MAKPRLSIALGQYSDAGAKPHNQDFHGALQPLGPDLVTKGIAVALADGISTSERGAEAAETAVKSFLNDYYCTAEGWTVRRSGEAVIAAANSWLHAQNARLRPREEGEDRERAGLICTFSALVLKGRAGHVFHIGDGQVARIRGDRVEPLTVAHRISLGGGRSYLGRALGANDAIEVDYRAIDLIEGDLFMLSTDGVHEHVGDEALLAIIAREPLLDCAAREIAEEARRAGSQDNLTVQLLRVTALPEGVLEDLLGSEAKLPPAPQPGIGERFEGYEIIEKLHGGHRSHAFLARDLVDDAPVVIKVPSTEHGQDEDALASLMLEEWVMRRLAHPNLLGAPPLRAPRRFTYSISRFIAGTTLYRWMQANPRPPLATVRRILGQVSAGLEAMHRRGILHRDLRPHNVIIDGAGKATVIDFGSAQVEGLDEIMPRSDEDAAFAGTIQYSAPELYLGYPATARSDVFSLGVIAYEMLTGQLPYGTRVSATRTRAAQRKLRYTPARQHNPDIPDWVDAALANALAIEPSRRCETPAELIGNLARPDPELLRRMPHPLLERGSVRFWRTLAAVLAAALVIAILTRPDIRADPPAEQEALP